MSYIILCNLVSTVTMHAKSRDTFSANFHQAKLDVDILFGYCVHLMRFFLQKNPPIKYASSLYRLLFFVLLVFYVLIGAESISILPK